MCFCAINTATRSNHFMTCRHRHYHRKCQASNMFVTTCVYTALQRRNAVDLHNTMITIMMMMMMMVSIIIIIVVVVVVVVVVFVFVVVFSRQVGRCLKNKSWERTVTWSVWVPVHRHVDHRMKSRCRHSHISLAFNIYVYKLCTDGLQYCCCYYYYLVPLKRNNINTLTKVLRDASFLLFLS